jgi:uncharacterized protein (TIRG00374 family)
MPARARPALPDAGGAAAAPRGRLTPRVRLALAGVAWLAATALVALALRAVGWRAALDAVRSARPGWLAVAALCHAGIVPLWAWQTFVLWPRGAAAPPGAPPPRYATAFELQALTATATNTVPAFLGQATGVALLADRGGVGTAGALGVFAQHNVVEGVAKVLVLLAAAQVAPLPPALRRAVVVLSVTAAVFAALLVAAALGAGRRGAVDPAGPSRAAVPGETGWTTRGRALLVRWAASLDAVREPRRLALALGIALGMKVAEAAGWWAVERAFGVAPRVGSPVLALAATNLASAIPASPGNLGVYEGAAYAAYHTLLGVPRQTAFALALVGHVCYLVPIVGLGWVLLSRRQWRALRGRREGAAR